VVGKWRLHEVSLVDMLCDMLGFSIEGPSQAKIDCHDNGDGSANISYFAFTPGEYAVHVLCDDEDINCSPWMANIVPASDKFDPSKVHSQFSYYYYYYYYSYCCYTVLIQFN